MSPASDPPLDRSLSEQEMQTAMTRIMHGEMPPDDIAAFLTALSRRGETADEITGAARVMRREAATIKAAGDCLDCCGTGGDGGGTYNVSTAVALIVAACGVPVAKHGNRAASSKSGAADVLESLGVNLDVSESKLEQALHELNFCFLMAPRHHTAMKYVAPVRKALGHRTIFNLLGPLANPAGATHQLLGVYDKRWLTPMAQTLGRLGAQRAWVVHGSDGLDEITITGTTHAAILEDGAITTRVLTPGDFGVGTADPADLRGGNAHTNGMALADLLAGAPGAYRDIAIVNAAAALHVFRATPIIDAAAESRRAIDSGAAWKLFAAYKDFVA